MPIAVSGPVVYLLVAEEYEQLSRDLYSIQFIKKMNIEKHVNLKSNALFISYAVIVMCSHRSC